ncbi:MAG: 2-amino-4-hydroxy-6-hydroxymethyldihydropteridine diphosphokinase [Planctomycetota bacterium]|jgi:2-amino-4-hydroxy-6-hydroxymethyldihydropteridine diphosphokinase
MPAANAYISLGANLGDRDASIARAVDLLEISDTISVLRVAPTIDSPALTQPGADPQPDYRNTASFLQTTLTPRELLDHMLDVERTLGRTRSDGLRWEPRTIDLDLLLYEDLVLDVAGLTLPHPAMHSREFVLEPLAHIAPEATHPVLNKTIAQLLASLRSGATTAVTLLMLLMASTTLAQDTSLDIIERSHTSLHQQPVAMHVGFNLRTDGGLESQTITIISEPGRIYLDLTSLRVLVTDNECTIQNPASGRWITLSDSQSTGMQLLASALPPIPLFVLDLLASDNPAQIHSSRLGSISWAVPDHRDATISIDGVAELDATLTLVLDVTTFAPQSAITRLSTLEGTRTIIENYTFTDPTPIPDLTSGRRVQSISQLVPMPGIVAVGDKLPPMLLLDTAGSALFTRPASPTAWLFTRATPTQNHLDLLDTLRSASELDTRLVTIIDDANPFLVVSAIPPAQHQYMRWSADPVSTIDQFAPDADTVLVLSDANNTIRLIRVVEGDPIDADALLATILDELASE